MNIASQESSASGSSPSVGFGVRIATIAWFLLGLCFLLSAPVLLDASPWTLVAAAVAGLVLTGLIAQVFRRLRPQWIKLACALIFAICILLATPIFYLALRSALKPPTMPQVVLTNGSKTLTFQGMIHIGSEPFYKAVFYDLQKALAEDSVIYYEGIRPDPVGDAWFRQMVSGNQELGDTYTSLANGCGLVFQNQVLQVLIEDMRARPERHVTADVTTLELKQEFDRLMASDPAFAATMRPRMTAQGAKSETLGDGPVGKFIAWQQRATGGQKALAGTVCRGVMGMVQERAGHSDDVMDRVLVDFRNRMLAKRIEAEPKQRIFLTYGAAHLPGLYQLLKQSDPAWHVATVKWMRTIETPEDVNGALGFKP